ncbi:MAG: isochorismatase family cysteine hydrolase [Trueperaceae bacterium]
MQEGIQVPDIPREDRVALDPSSTALVVVDMQNDFAHPDGVLYSEDANTVLPAVRALLTAAREERLRIVFTQDWHTDDDPEFAIWGEHAKAGTWGAEVVDELTPHEGEMRIKKLRYDAFYGTSLDHVLRQWGVTDVVVAGTVANICVLHTAGSAALRYYRVVVPEDAIAAITPFDKVAALRQVTFLYRGSVTTTAGIAFN